MPHIRSSCPLIFLYTHTHTLAHIGNIMAVLSIDWYGNVYVSMLDLCIYTCQPIKILYRWSFLHGLFCYMLLLILCIYVHVCVFSHPQCLPLLWWYFEYVLCFWWNRGKTHVKFNMWTNRILAIILLNWITAFFLVFRCWPPSICLDDSSACECVFIYVSVCCAVRIFCFFCCFALTFAFSMRRIFPSKLPRPIARNHF